MPPGGLLTEIGLGQPNAMQPGLRLGRFEWPERLRLKAEKTGLDLAGQSVATMLDAAWGRGIKAWASMSRPSFEQATFELERP